MDYKTFIELFPSAKLINIKDKTETDLSLYIDGQWYLIPTDTLTEREITLINQLNQTEAEQPDSNWAHYLFNNRPMPSCQNDYIRLIQLNLNFSKQSLDLTYWYEAISNLFTGVVDIFFKDDEQCYVVQQFSEDLALSTDEISDLLQTVEDDYAIKITAYIGHFWEITQQVRKLWLEEVDLFSSQNQFSFKSVVSLSHLALPYYTDKSRHNSLILKSFYEDIKDHPEWLEMIQALWLNQRNLTEAAKALYLHRNTLQYRIAKFEEKTHLSLKESNDLALAYLIILMK